MMQSSPDQPVGPQSRHPRQQQNKNRKWALSTYIWVKKLEHATYKQQKPQMKLGCEKHCFEKSTLSSCICYWNQGPRPEFTPEKNEIWSQNGSAAKNKPFNNWTKNWCWQVSAISTRNNRDQLIIRPSAFVRPSVQVQRRARAGHDSGKWENMVTKLRQTVDFKVTATLRNEPWLCAIQRARNMEQDSLYKWKGPPG